jgi:hypothetical protein
MEGKGISVCYGGEEQDACGGKMRGRWEGNARGLLAILTKRQGIE